MLSRLGVTSAMTGLSGLSGLSTGGYDNKVLSIPDLLGYWPLSDTSEPVGRIAPDLSGNGFDGLYFTGGVGYNIDGPGDGLPAINLDGTGNVCFYGAGLAAQYNPTELTIACFVRIASAEWGDVTTRYITNFGFDAAANFSAFRKDNGVDRILFLHFAGGTNKTFVHTFSPRNTDWLHVGITVSESGDSVRGYINGVDIGGASALGTNVGGLSVNRGTAGSTSCTGALTPMIGDIGRFALYSRALNAAEMLQIGVI